MPVLRPRLIEEKENVGGQFWLDYNPQQNPTPP
jgi:hypothetical protein